MIVEENNVIKYLYITICMLFCSFCSNKCNTRLFSWTQQLKRLFIRLSIGCDKKNGTANNTTIEHQKIRYEKTYIYIYTVMISVEVEYLYTLTLYYY